MEPITVIEVVERSGKLREVVKLSQLPFTIGRGYGNDLVVYDPYVSPTHLTIAQGETGALEACDTGSDNGLYLLGSKARSKQVTLSPTTDLRIGHTILRFRGPASPLMPTALDELLNVSAIDKLERPVPALTLLCLGIACGLGWSYQTYFSNSDMRRWLPSAVGVILFHLFCTLPWTGIWALVSRTIRHRANFFAHLSVASLALLLWYVLWMLQSYANFAFSNSTAVSLVAQLIYFLVGTSLVYLHLQYATLAPRFRTLLMSSGFSFFVVGIALLYGFSQQFDFSDEMHFPRELKPPAFKLAGDRPVQQFVQQASHLEGEIQALLDE